MENRARKGHSKSLAAQETPIEEEKESKIEQLTRSYLKTSNSPLKFATKEEMERRENDELCSKHGAPIIAFEKETGETL